jgi:hypothetical protein
MALIFSLVIGIAARAPITMFLFLVALLHGTFQEI